MRHAVLSLVALAACEGATLIGPAAAPSGTDDGGPQIDASRGRDGTFSVDDPPPVADARPRPDRRTPDASGCPPCRNAACVGGRCQVKVLIYAGSDAGGNGVKNTGASLDAANAKGLVPGVRFSHAIATVVSGATLAGVNVLVMPGGDSGWGYLTNPSIDGAAIKQLVQNGGGYFGTCAGAYAGSAKTTGYAQYTGWGVAPSTTAIAFSYQGNLAVRFTAFGTGLLGASGAMTLHHWNGPAMVKDPASGPAQVVAHYDSTLHKGKVAIVADHFGSGRAVLTGPHPELDPQHPEIVSRLVGWASGSFNP